MGWMSPTGGSGTNWTNVQRAYDENESNFADSNTGVGWTGWIELTVSPLLCDMIRFKVSFIPTYYSSFEAEVYYEDGYHTIYQGGVINVAWVSKDVIPGSPGQTKVVSKMRLRFLRSVPTSAKVYEVDFNQVQSVIPNIMKHYRNMRTE